MKNDELYNELEDELATEESKVKELLKDVISTVIYVAVLLGICYLVITYVGQRTQVSGSSMEGTLSNGDNLIVDKITYRFNDIERFDVVIFPVEGEGDEDVYYIKRIIGLPGETVWINAFGEIYIGGVLLEEDYGLETIANAGIASSPITLGEDEYFVLGDNRNNSLDSRFESVGNITSEQIIGRAWLRIYPFSEFGLVENIQ